MADDTERRLFHAELLKYEALRCYRPGWTYQTYLARFGSSPPSDWNHDAPAQWIRPATYTWIRERLIAYAQKRAMAGSRKRSHSKPETT